MVQRPIFHNDISSRLESDRKKTAHRKGSLRMRHETLALLRFFFSGEIPFAHKHNIFHIK